MYLVHCVSSTSLLLLLMVLSKFLWIVEDELVRNTMDFFFSLYFISHHMAVIYVVELALFSKDNYS